MDWFSWLSKTGLEPSLVYEYGLTFSHNELEQEDTVYFNHEFLQSMGISIAKHRLEILKLARKEKKGKIINNRPMASRLIVAIKRTKRYLTNYMRTLRCEDESSTALVVVPSSSSSASRGSSSYYGTTRWKSSVMKRNKKLIGGSNIKQERLLLTNGSPSPTVVPAAFDGFSSPMVYHFHKEGKIDEGYWSAAVEEIRWDTMFQDLKPN